MRGMTKLFSMMSGLGLRLYTGEDLNLLELNGENNEEKTIPPKQSEKTIVTGKQIGRAHV